jgi:ABC-type uncharacterized transport system substrate-binding protein
MRRREFIRLIGAAAAYPLAVHAQQSGRVRRIGVLMNSAEADPAYHSYLRAFVGALRSLGWSEGQNLQIEYRWNAGDAERARASATELVALAPDLILAASTTNLAAAMRVTRTIPIVFLSVSDPVAQGFVSNLARPGGNITGFTAYEFTIGGKWLEMLKQVAPGLARVAVIFNPDTSPQSKLFLSSVEAGAPSLGIETTAFRVRNPEEIQAAIVAFSRQPNGGLILTTDAFTLVHRQLIVDAAAHHRLPAIYSSRDYVAAGGLLYYGLDTADSFRRVAAYVDRILRGANPGDLPIQQPVNFRFVINMKAARVLGIDVPTDLLLRADEVIE